MINLTCFKTDMNNMTGLKIIIEFLRLIYRIILVAQSVAAIIKLLKNEDDYQSEHNLSVWSSDISIADNPSGQRVQISKRLIR